MLLLVALLTTATLPTDLKPAYPYLLTDYATVLSVFPLDGVVTTWAFVHLVLLGPYRLLPWNAWAYR